MLAANTPPRYPGTVRPTDSLPPLPPRVLGCYPPTADPLAAADGPVLVAVCGAHGNEPAGVEAAGAVLAALHALRPSTRGRFVALVGNRTALRRGVRFVDTDLNRLWTDERIGVLADRASPGRDAARDVAGRSADAPYGAGRTGGGTVEAFEQAELFDALSAVTGRTDARGAHVTILDLHTTSAPSEPFAIALPTARNRRVLAGVPLPLVHGLEGRLTGTLSSWLSRCGHAALSVEGGQHDDPSSVRHLVDVLWLVMANSGVLDRRVAGWSAHAAALRVARAGRPRGVTVAYRHAIGGGEGFRMRPGLASFQRVRKGAVLAETHAGPVRAPLSGVLLFPLYQDLGDDGFFIGRRNTTRWPHRVMGQEGHA